MKKLLSLRRLSFVYGTASLILAYLILTQYSAVLVGLQDVVDPEKLRWAVGSLFIGGAIVLFVIRRYEAFVVGTLPIGLYAIAAVPAAFHNERGYIYATYYILTYLSILFLWAEHSDG